MPILNAACGLFKAMIMRKAFSLVELIIVVGILGILAAMVMPSFQNHAAQAKEAAAKDNLRILRNAIQVYAAQHNDVPPGYPDGDTSATPSQLFFILQLGKASNASGTVANPGTEGYDCGPYISEPPGNPFNNMKSIKMLSAGEDFTAGGAYGWLYKPTTRDIRLNWAGADRNGVNYIDY